MTFQTSYKALAGNIAKLRDLDCMPIQIDFKPLDERDGLENTFVRCQKKKHAGTKVAVISSILGS